MTNLAKRKNPRLKGFDYSLPNAYFLTVSAKDNKNFFCNPALNLEIITCLKQEKTKLGMLIYAFCLMPNHLHLLISPAESKSNVSKFVGGFKSKATKIAWKYGLSGKIWQERFYDHIVRKNESLKEICEYILNNPIRKGLVEKLEDYQYSGIMDEIKL